MRVANFDTSLDFKLSNIQKNTITREDVPDEWEEPVFDADDFILYGPASVEQVDKEGQEIRMEALDGALDRYFESEEAPGIISMKHNDVPVGVPARQWTTDENVLRSEVRGDRMYLVANLANDTEKAKEARLRALNGTFDGYSVTVYSKEYGRDEDGNKITTKCDLHAVTLGSDDQIVNPDATFDVVDYKSFDNRLIGPLLEKLDEKDFDDYMDDSVEIGRGPMGAVYKEPDGSMRGNHPTSAETPMASEWSDPSGDPLRPRDIKDHFDISDFSSVAETASRYEDNEMSRYEARQRIKNLEGLDKTAADAVLGGLTDKMFGDGLDDMYRGLIQRAIDSGSPEAIENAEIAFKYLRFDDAVDSLTENASMETRLAAKLDQKISNSAILEADRISDQVNYSRGAREAMQDLSRWAEDEDDVQDALDLATQVDRGQFDKDQAADRISRDMPNISKPQAEEWIEDVVGL